MCDCFRYLFCHVSRDPVTEFHAPPTLPPWGAIQRGTPPSRSQRAFLPPGMCAKEGAPGTSLSLTSSQHRRRHMLTQAQPGSTGGVGGRLVPRVSTPPCSGATWGPGAEWTGLPWGSPGPHPGPSVQCQPVSSHTPHLPRLHDACGRSRPGFVFPSVCLEVTPSPGHGLSCTDTPGFLPSSTECSYTGPQLSLAVATS